MQIKLFEVVNEGEVEAVISKARISDAPSKKEGWNFNWHELFRTEGSFFFKITLRGTPTKIEGLIMLSIYFGEMVYMNNLELAPHNIGKEKQYDRIAGCLIAYGCRVSQEEGKGNYQGYLTFESKTELIPLYTQKYGAIRASGLKMFIDNAQGEKLIAQYLGDKSKAK